MADDKENVAANKFVYRDKYSRNGWLNLMNERLKLAKELLKDDGVIFVSIDDSEQAYLKVLMDEIFGEENFVVNLNYQKKNSGSGADTKYIRQLTEYILFYAKDIDKLKINEIKKDIRNESRYKYTDEFVETRGKYQRKQLDMASLTWSSGLDYEIEIDGKKYYAGGSKERWIDRQSGKHALKDWRWRWSKEKLQWGLENKFIEVINNKIFTKQYQFVDNNNNNTIRTEKYTNIINNVMNSVGTEEQKSIFNVKVFDSPKPVELIIHLIKIVEKTQDTRILDFFAGSGTTGHAVLELNREDGGNRTFTLVTNNQNNIGLDVNYERLYRINHGKGTKDETFEWGKKNQPYRSNLDVFNIEHIDVSLFQNKDNIRAIINKLIKVLNDFGIKTNLQNPNEYLNLLNSLHSLKPELKKDEDEIN
nr:site-specific DNA-methyltransferase [Mycoplasmopsis mustelae]